MFPFSTVTKGIGTITFVFFQWYKKEMKEFCEKVFFQPQKHLAVKEKVQCYDGCRLWEGVIWNVAADCRGLMLYMIKFDEVSDKTVS